MNYFSRKHKLWGFYLSYKRFIYGYLRQNKVAVLSLANGKKQFPQEVKKSYPGVVVCINVLSLQGFKKCLKSITKWFKFYCFIWFISSLMQNDASKKNRKLNLKLTWNFSWILTESKYLTLVFPKVNAYA